MHSRTLTLSALSTLVLVASASPLPGDKKHDGGDRIDFKDVKKVNDDKFKKTNFDVHDKKVHDKNFNNIENKDRDVFKAVKFRKDEDDDDKHDFYKRQFEVEAFTDVDTDSSLNDFDDEYFGRGAAFDFDLDTDILSRFDTGEFEDFDDDPDFDFGGHDLVKRGKHDDDEEVRFKEIKKLNDDRFKKTNFNVHDKAVHDKDFNNIEDKDRDVLKATKFRKDEDDDDKHGFYKRDLAINELNLREAAGFDFDFDIDNELDLDTDSDLDFDQFRNFDGIGEGYSHLDKRGDGDDEIEFKNVKKINDDKFDRTNFNTREKKVSDKDFNQVEDVDKDKFSLVDFSKDGDDDDIRFKEINKVNDDKFKKTNFNTHDLEVNDKNFDRVNAKDRDVLEATKFRKEDGDDDFYY